MKGTSAETLVRDIVRSLTPKRAAAAKRDLALLAGVALLESETLSNDFTDKQHALIISVFEWVAAERAAGTVP
jgi:hypothetical protein